MDSTRDAHQTDDDVVLDLKGLLRALLRRWPAILVVSIAFGAGAFLLASILPPTYRAETKILIENREVNLSTNAQVTGERNVVDQEAVASQVQLLTSRDLARRVADVHDLADRAEFDGARSSIVDAVMVAIGLGRDPMRVSPEERVLDAFMERLKVYRVEGSRVVVVEFTSRDPDLAAAVANTISEQYMALQGEAKRRTSEDQTRWLGDEIDRLRGKVRDAEAAVEIFRSGSDLIVGANNTTVARQQITDLTNAITAARSDKAAADSRANELAVLIGGQGGVAGAAEVIDSDGFRALRSREIALRSRQSELAVALLPAHPQMQTIRSQIEDIERQQVAEARRALSTLRNDARVAEARIAALTASLDQLKATSAENGENEVELRALEREAASQRNLLEGLLVRYSEAIARQNAEILPADARVISRASVPGEPTFPKVVPMTVVSALAGLLLVVAWIVSLEFLSGRALVRVTATPGKPRPLATLSAETSPSAPTMEDRASRFRSMVETALAENDRAPAAPRAGGFDGDEAGQGVDPDLVIADAVVLHAALVAGGASRVAMMTAGDGSALAPTIDAFARAAADEGTSIVVVDMVAAHAGRGPGLSDLMTGEAAFGEIIHRNRATRAHQIEVGSRPINPQSFGQVTLETILDALANAYDVVVLSLGDLPAETLSPRVAALADRVVVVGAPGDPRVRQAQVLVSEAGVRFVNVVPPVGDWSEAAA